MDAADKRLGRALRFIERFYALMSSYALNRTNGTIVSSGQKREYRLLPAVVELAAQRRFDARPGDAWTLLLVALGARRPRPCGLRRDGAQSLLR